MDYRFQEVLKKAKRTGRERVLISMDLKNLTDYRNEVKGTGIANILPVPVFVFLPVPVFVFYFSSNLTATLLSTGVTLSFKNNFISSEYGFFGTDISS
jgi:hypothetical protein